MRQIYESYVDAKRKNNERTEKIDYETVAKSLKKMVPKLDRETIKTGSSAKSVRKASAAAICGARSCRSCRPPCRTRS